MKKIGILLIALSVVLSTFGVGIALATENEVTLDEVQLVSFPGAEGGGKYTKGARASEQIEVYHITSLEDDPVDTKEGTLRHAVSTGDTNVGRIIVFDIGGVIDLKDVLRINRGHITILGQTAPGDGITITGNEISFGSAAVGNANDGYVGNVRDEMIIRYLRIRPTEKNGGEPDGIGGRWNKNVIIDHCSVSWTIDEGLTLYAGSNRADNTRGVLTPSRDVTMQYCIGGESLRMSSHFKGAHGYGAIWGATNASYHHNLLIHNDSRNPRLDRNLQGTDITNNVFYNWGVTDSAYGAESLSAESSTANKTRIMSQLNWVNNYHSYGPSTRKDLRTRLFNAPKGNDAPARFYMNGNYVYGSSNNSNNSKDVNNASLNEFATSPITSIPYQKVNYLFTPGVGVSKAGLVEDGTVEITQLTEVQTAEEALNNVIANAGATLPKRDSIDAKLVEDAKNKTGRIANRTYEVGGLVGFETVRRVFEIPTDWKTANGMGTAKDSDLAPSGYTWIEQYINEWTQAQSAPTNPKITVTSPAIASLNSTVNGKKVNNDNWAVIKEGETVKYTAEAEAHGDTQVTKMELYDGENLIGTYPSSSIDENISDLTVGDHYLTCLAYNDKGETTRSVTSIVYVNHVSSGDWTVAEIGTSTYFKGKSGGGERGGLLTIGGSGRMRDKTTHEAGGAGTSGTGVKNDACTFMYQELYGDFSFVAKMDDIQDNEHGALAGLMVRESLADNSRMAFLADGWMKLGENVMPVYRSTTNTISDSIYMKRADGTFVQNDGGYASEEGPNYPVPNYLKVEREGDKIILSVSDSGTDWTDNVRQPMELTFSDLSPTLCVGFAVDSVQGVTDASPKAYYSMSKFSEVDLDYDKNALKEIYKVPFHDKAYNAPPWTFSDPSKLIDKNMAEGKYPESGDQVKDDGHVMVVNLVDGNTKRKFDEVSEGISTFTFDYLTKGKDSSDVCKILFYDGDPKLDSSNVVCDIRVNENSSFTAIDQNGSEIPIGAENISSIVKDNWYNITIEFDNYARLEGKTDWIKMSAKKYDHYKNQTFSDTFEDITVPAKGSYALSGVEFYSMKGCAKYVGDFKLDVKQVMDIYDVYVESFTSIENGSTTITVRNNSDDAKQTQVFISQYEDGKLLKKAEVQNMQIEANSSEDFTFENLDNSKQTKVYLWDENNSPCCPATTITD